MAGSRSELITDSPDVDAVLKRGGVLRSCSCGGTRIRGRTDQKDPDIQSGQEIDHAEKLEVLTRGKTSYHFLFLHLFWNDEMGMK